MQGGGVIVLLVTMNKETLLAEHQYAEIIPSVTASPRGAVCRAPLP